MTCAECIWHRRTQNFPGPALAELNPEGKTGDKQANPSNKYAATNCNKHLKETHQSNKGEYHVSHACSRCSGKAPINPSGENEKEAPQMPSRKDSCSRAERSQWDWSLLNM